MKPFILGLVALLVVGVFLWLFRKKDLLSYFSAGRWWLTWLSIAVITLMDELTSIFYAPSEAWRFIGAHAIPFIIIVSLFMRFVSTRMVEIAEILEHHNIRGGGVYSFSYLTLGPTFSFVAVSSILVALSVLSVFWPGPNYGIDFTGGTEVQLRFRGEVATAELRQTIE